MEIEHISKIQKENRMRVETVLNRVQKYKSFVFSNVKLVMEYSRLILLVEIQPRSNSQALRMSRKKDLNTILSLV